MINIEEKLNWLQPILFKQFKKTVQQKQLAHAYLFEGVSGTGKKELSLWLAASLLCQEGTEKIPCEKCQNCRRVFEHQHPDVIEIIPDGLSIKVEQVRNLKAEFSKSGVESQQKIFIIEDVEKMTTGAANSLLKFLEEPEGRAVAFLLTTAKQRILPTILSRCQLVHFQALTKKKLMLELETKGLSINQASLLVQLTNSVEEALEMNENEWFQEAKTIAWKWFTLITNKDRQSFVYVQTTIMPHFKDRDAHRRLLDLILLAYRDVLMIHYHTVDVLAYARYQKELDHIKTEHTGIVTIQAIETVLLSRKKLESNVNAQGVFEQLVLQLMK